MDAQELDKQFATVSMVDDLADLSRLKESERRQRRG
jgi:hypothetical protein